VNSSNFRLTLARFLGICLYGYLSDFAKTWSLGIRLDSGETRIQAKPASQNPGGAPSMLAWMHSPSLELSAGGLFGVQQSKLGEGEGAFY